MNNKLSVTLDNRDYQTFSGGEKRKIDLALALAQRDLALSISGTSSNILILDEIFDNLDETAISSVSNMFSKVSTEIDSMFVITHMPSVNLAYDITLVVTKEKDEISVVNTEFN